MWWKRGRRKCAGFAASTRKSTSTFSARKVSNVILVSRFTGKLISWWVIYFSILINFSFSNLNMVLKKNDTKERSMFFFYNFFFKIVCIFICNISYFFVWFTRCFMFINGRNIFFSKSGISKLLVEIQIFFLNYN